MGLDHGQRRIGIALSDPLRLTAQPHSILQRGTLDEDFATLTTITRDEAVSQIVVGLPSDAADGIGSQAMTVIRWARKLRQAAQTPIIFWDESYSSEQAEQTREARRRRAKSPSAPIDDLAAAIILQDYLSAASYSTEPGTPLEAYDDLE
jgi:putative Holliday junction resolvase